MPRITEECVSRIKDSADIVEVLGRFLQLRRAGNAWKACCPFHSEKTPSFHVNPAKQIFHCFGCGVGGDTVRFLMLYENLDYPTALRRLADMNGIPVVEEDENPEMAQRRRLRSRVVELNQLAMDYFHRQLCRTLPASHARAYLKTRGFNIEIAKSWQLGWAPPDFSGLRQLATSHNMDTRLLTEAYLLSSSSRGLYPVFRDRLMFPIHNVRGEVVGFSGRIMTEGQDPRKYVNTSDTVAFHKGELLFGLHKATGAIAKAGMTVVVCEGQLDVIACHEKAEIRNAVAGLGTAFTDEHAQILRKYAKKAVLCYDGDNAGINASEKTFRKLAQVGMDIYLAALPAGEDPDSLIRHQGSEALQQAITGARPYLEVRVGYELEAIKGDTNARAALIPRMADLAAEITDPNRRDVAVIDIATRLNAGLDDLRTTVAEIIRARKKTTSTPAYHYSPNKGNDYPDISENISTVSERSDTWSVSIQAIRLHPTIRGLIQLAATNEQAQSVLVDRIEELQAPINSLPGGIILQKLLEQLPTPGDPTAWQTFCSSLPPEQAASLKSISNDIVAIPDFHSYVNQACARAAQDSVRARIDLLKARVHSGNLPADKTLACMQEVSELQKLLSGSR